MKNTVLKWIEQLKERFHPQQEDHQPFVDDELYLGSRSRKRRARRRSIKRLSTWVAGLIVAFLLIFGIYRGISHFSSSHRAARLNEEIGRLYTDNRHADLKDSVTQTKLDKLKSDVDSLKHYKNINSLRTKQVAAQNAYDVRADYSHLFNKQTRVALNVTTKKVDHQLKNLKQKKVPAQFRTNYTKQLKDVRKIVVMADKLSKRYKVIMKARKNNLSVDVTTVEKLIKDMSKNQKSQKTVDQQTKLISLKTVINKEDKQAAKAAKAAAEAAARAEAIAAAERAAAESSRAESESASKAASKAESESSSAAKASSEAEAKSESEAEAAAEAQANANAQTSTDASDSTNDAGTTNNTQAYYNFSISGTDSQTNTSNTSY